MIISQPGISHKSIEFDFIVPEQECGKISFYRFEKFSRAQKTPTGCIKQESGEKASGGWYRIINEIDGGCSLEVIIKSNLSKSARQDSLGKFELGK